METRCSRPTQRRRKPLADAGIKAADPLALDIAQAREQQDRYFAHFNRELPPIAEALDLRIPGPAGEIALRLYRPSQGCRAAADRVRARRGLVGRRARFACPHHDPARAVQRLRGLRRRFPSHAGVPLSGAARRGAGRAGLAARARSRAHRLRAAAPVLFGESAGATLCSVGCARVARSRRAVRRPAWCCSIQRRRPEGERPRLLAVGVAAVPRPRRALRRTRARCRSRPTCAACRRCGWVPARTTR